MYIIGTSGHIDHGKTSLILALTGIDCDRLPEEKQREMTIDIGFADIEYPDFGNVSIIDVPGHERFIRNMAAGAWGIDLALLVIAVDDSWMPQTEDHFKVIDYLGIERMIVVLTKTDIADQETIEITEEEVKERLTNTRFKNYDIVKVSSKTGSGIDELKKIIYNNLKKLSRTEDAGKPYLFVDRAFESKGHGTVITGTLKNGSFFENDELTVLPGNVKVRIKTIESHHHALNEGTPSRRTALNLHGIRVDELKRGQIIVKNNFFTGSADIIAAIKLSGIKKSIKNNHGIEILIGTYSIRGKIILLSDLVNEENEARQNEILVRIKLDDKWFFFPGESFIITNPGGYRIIGGGKVIIPDYAIIKDKKSLKKKINLFTDLSLKGIIEFFIKIKVSTTSDEIKARLPYKNKYIENTISEFQKAGSIVKIDELILDKEYYTDLKNKILEIIKKNVGLNIKEISDIADADLNISKIIIREIQNSNNILEKEGRYFANDSVTVETLTDDKKKILQQLKEKGTEGIDIDKIKDDSMKKKIKDLIRPGFAVSLDGNIIYHPEVYNDLKKKIIGLFDTRERITIADAKECTSLSRKYLIPLLNKIESDGLIKRLGDFRVKV
ncbi:MAG: selenocysteine-specific translation elongation factor [Spirochaetes bacterium]|nr:selenocysteine-specific translation elongation factor [Spirochaetota bacterium]